MNAAACRVPRTASVHALIGPDALGARSWPAPGATCSPRGDLLMRRGGAVNAVSSSGGGTHCAKRF